MTIYQMLVYFYIYGFLGWCVEVAYAAIKERKFVNRGFLSGPICPIYGVGVTLVILFLEPFRGRLILLYFASVVLVSVLEGITGFVLDKLFHHKWWDYSRLPLNIGGYVCLLFSLIWGVACVLIVKFVHHVIAAEVEHLPRLLGIIVLVILNIILLADVYVTTTNVVKMNKYLSYIEDVVSELHNISNTIGEGIYKGVMEAIDVGDEAKEKWENVTDEVKARVLELEQKYKDLAEKQSKASKRLIKAFPAMYSRKYKRAFLATKERIKKAGKKNEKK